MGKNIRSIIKEDKDLHTFSLYKPSKDRNTWTFKVNDSTSRLNGISGNMSDYNYRIVTLQRGTHFFISYKFIFEDGEYEYFVDPKKSIHRSTTKKYVEGVIGYVIWSNDISHLKNDPSFKYTQMEMVRDGVSNYLDLCVKFGDYSSVGTGLTRDIRNLVVLDIDVDCEKPIYKSELERLMNIFLNYNFLPNFYIINHSNNHVQLQWLIKDCEYKRILWDNVNKKIKYLEDTCDIDKEMSLRDFNFMELTGDGKMYRKFTKGLTKLSDKRKFGDENYTFWKAKNFYTALLGKYNLELKMPVDRDNEIKYLTQEEMLDIFSTRESRYNYFDKSSTMEEIYEKTNEFMFSYLNTISETTISKIKDDIDELFDDPGSLYNFKLENNYDLSRNSFVFNKTRTITWENMRELNYNDKFDYLKLSQKNQKAFRTKVKKMVKSLYDSENKKYNGEWPGTTNRTKYTNDEFNATFNSSFDFAIEKFSNQSYSDTDRDKSLTERILKKELRHVLILYYLSTYHKIKKKELLSILNDMLVKSGKKKISNTTFKRDIGEIGKYNTGDKERIFEHVLSCIDERKRAFEIMCDKTDDKKEINICKKRMNRLWVENLDKIREFINNYGES